MIPAIFEVYNKMHLFGNDSHGCTTARHENGSSSWNSGRSVPMILIQVSFSVKAVIDQLAAKTRRNLPRDIRIATVWYRPSERTIRAPDFYVHETRDWLVLPYELVGLSLQELRSHKPELEPIMPRLAAWLAKH